MILDRIAPHFADAGRSHSANDLSRRRFLQAGAAAGGGLLLSLSLPFANDASRGRRRWRLHAERLHPHRAATGRSSLTMPYVEMGQGDLHLHPDADRRRTGGGPETGAAGACSAEPKALRQSPAGGRAGDGRLDRDTRRLAADARGRRGRKNDARRGRGQALERRSGVLPRAKRRSDSPADGAEASKYGELAADAARMAVPENVVLKRPEDFKLIGTPAKRLDAPAKVNGTAVYRHRCSAAGREDRDARAVARVRRPREERGRCGGQGGQRRASDRAARRRRRRRGRSYGGREERAWRRWSIEWDEGPHAKLNTDEIAGELEKATLSPGAVAQNIGDVDKAMAGAATKVEAIYQVPFLAHATMEPMNCTVHVREDGCEVWVGTQVVARAQAAAAKATGLPLDKVVVHNHLIGGGFGRRLEVDGVTRAVQIAQAGRRPGEGRVDARGRYPARHVPALLLRSHVRRARREGHAGRLEPSLRGLLGHRAMASSGIQQRSRSRQRPRARSIWPTPSRTCASNICGSSRRAFRPPSGAASARRTMSS